LDQVRARGYVLTYCFLTLQAMQMWSAIRRFR
jgi:hypothetical protein